MRQPGSATAGVPAFETSATSEPASSLGMTCRTRALSLCSWQLRSSGDFTPWASKSRLVLLVSSQQIRSHEPRTSRALSVMSFSEPMGVATT